MACQECYEDPQCVGWASTDNVTVSLFSDNLRANKVVNNCVGAVRHHSPWERMGGGNWFGIAKLGGCKKDDHT